MSVLNNNGKVSMFLFHCYFNGSESITHFEHESDPVLYKSLDNLYGVLISDNSGQHRKITAGFVIKTTLDHNNPAFLEVLGSVKNLNGEIDKHIHEKCSFIPFKLNMGNDEPLTETEFLRIMQSQFMRYNVDGTS